MDAAVPCKILSDGFPKFEASGIRGFFEQDLLIVGQNLAHDLAQNRNRKSRIGRDCMSRMRLQSGGWVDRKMGGSIGRNVAGNMCSVFWGSETVSFTEDYAEDYEEAASFPRFRVAFIAEQSISVFDGYGADADFVRKQAFGREFAVVWKETLYDIITQLFVYLQINRSVFFINDIFHLAILFSPFLVVL